LTVSDEVFQVLAKTTLAISVALALVGLLRKPIRLAVGARAAYWLWLLVPAMAASALLPAPTPVLLSAQVNFLPEQFRSAFTAIRPGYSADAHALLVNLLLAIWSIGAFAMLLSMLARQQMFAKALGVLTRDADGLYRCDVGAPMLVGAWHSRIVVPADFEVHYSREEREFILAHECAHASRHDVAVNAVASFALCVCWFNPLMYFALAWLRMDQEIACDALVLAQRGGARRRYADALLKTQLATEYARTPPIGCHWQSVHPLEERISMLRRPFPGRRRRFAGIAVIATFTGVVSYAAWAGQPVIDTGQVILVDLKITISDQQTNEVKALATQYLVHSGEMIKDATGRPLDFTCTPYLTNESEGSAASRDQTARGIPPPTAGQILLDCEIRRDGKVVQRPAVISKDGKLATIDTADSDGPKRYRFDIIASTSPEKIAAAQKRPSK
jgi:bla regulator protein blaR1